MSLGTDPRADPRMAAALRAVGLDGHGEPPPVTATSPYEEQLGFIDVLEGGFQMLFGALFDGLPEVAGVERSVEHISGPNSQVVTLHIHRPAGSGAGEAHPGVLHLHGGGMTAMSATDPNYVRWRDLLAAAGLVVVGVEFRNAGGALGPHPYPAGLDDCATALAWMHANRAELGVSKLVVSGESGGANLSLATTLRAARDGMLHAIDGVYAQCPYISGLYASPPPELPSLTENSEYFLGGQLMGAMAAVYDPLGQHARDPLAWPYFAEVDDLRGLPPHVISVNELDPLRDEGLAYHRRLLAAGVSSVGRTVHGTCHAGDMIFEAAIPDVTAATVRDIAGFARSL